MRAIKYQIEKSVFGVCTLLGEKMGIPTKRIRMFFIYSSCLTLGSPVLFYLVLAFWMRMKSYISERKNSVWDL